jgi:PAS domain S-box-containing protein
MGFRSALMTRPSGVPSRYALAVLALAFAVLMRLLTAHFFSGIVPYHAIWAAIAFSAWYCGLGPSILVALLGMITISLPWPGMPLSSAWSPGIAGEVSALVFVGLLVLLGEISRRAVAERELAEQLARESHGLFDTFMDHSPGIAYIKDRDGRYIYVNRTMRERFNLPALVGKTDFEVHGKQTALAYRENDLSVLRDAKPGEFVEYTTEADGKHAWLSIKFPVTDPDGNVFVGGKSFDITERVNAEEALLKAHRELETRVHERTAQLEEANENLRELSARLLQVRDEEHRRIARELHDSVGQLLAALSMNVALVQKQADQIPSEVAKIVAESADLVEQTVREIRTISHLLHPPLLDEVGLASALRWYVDGFSERSGIKVNLEFAPGLDRLHPDVELALFRMVQESLSNIHRHSGSETASIRIYLRDGELCLEIKDTGRGISDEMRHFLESRGKVGVGIRGMRERLRLIGGRFELESDAHGTTVRASLPLPPAETAGSEQNQEQKTSAA